MRSHLAESRAGVTLIPNIGPRGRRQRLRFGLTAAAVAGVLIALLFLFDAPRLWRLACFPPLWLGALGFFQARDKT